MSARSLPYDSLTLHAIVHELKCLIVGAQVQQIRQPSNDEIELALRAPGRTHHLRISCDPRAARMHLASGRTPTPGAAGTFAMSLRKHVEGGIVQSVAQVGFDRIAVIEIANQARLLRLMVEIMGRHSNILLLDQHDVILDCCRHAGPSVNRLRVLLPGRPYLAPPVASGELDPLADACEAAVDAMAGLRGLELEEALRGAFVGMSPFLASELSARTELRGIASAWDETVGRAVRCEWAPVVVRDVEGRPLGAYPFPLTHTYGWVQEGAPTANAAIAEAYAARIAAMGLEASRRELTTRISGAMEARRARLDEALKNIELGSKADQFARMGDLLLASGACLDLSAGCVEAPDLYGAGQTVSVPVDPRLSVAENAEAKYARARRLRSAKRWAEDQLPGLEEEVAGLSDALDRVKAASCPEDLRAAEAVVEGLMRGPSAVERQRAPGKQPGPVLKGVRRIEGPDGWDILVGMSAEGNDRMVRSACAPDDLWFHVRSHTSAHVVIRNPSRKPDIPQHVIEAAAMIAAQNSKAKHSSSVPVDYTFCKHVRRPRKAAHGTVTYSHERTIHVDPGR